MSDNEWSDDETNNEINIKKQPRRDFPPSDSESEDEYEDYNSIIMEKLKQKSIDSLYSISNSIDNSKPKTEKKDKKSKENKKKIIIFDYSKVEEDKPKKWVSKRMESRKKDEGKIKEVRRKFNPRLPPPSKDMFKNKSNENNQNLNIENFPKL
jgi:hypothetical protein